MRDIICDVYQTIIDRGLTKGMAFVKEAESNGYVIDVKDAYNYLKSLKLVYTGETTSVNTSTLCDVLMCLDIRMKLDY